MKGFVAFRFRHASLRMLICLFSCLVFSQANSAAASALADAFQSALDAFQNRYGFPGATAAYVLSDGTVGVSRQREPPTWKPAHR